MPSECESFEALLDGSKGMVDGSTAGADDAAAILYTSGTTARPKGVTHTHGTLASAVLNYVEAVGLGAEDVVLGMLSMSHIFGYTLQLLSPLSVGATVVAAPSFDAARVLDAVRRHRVTHLYGLPLMFDTLTRDPLGESTAFQSLRYCLAGGDAVSRTLSDRVRDVLSVELHEGCGMTEVIPYALNRPCIENRVGSIGQPSAGMELRLVDEMGKDVSEGEVGEILVRSKAVMRGYWEDAEATAAALQDGWFHTGDLGRRDTAGYYWFVGRRKEIIVRGGSNISPLEVEAVLARHPAVQEVGVVGVPHPALGEMVAAFVVLKSGADSSEQDLRRFAAERIAEYKVPERMTFLADLPRGLTGKVQRRTLREWGAAAAQS
jgi:long-chain acyl-CoA synthetase